MKWQGDSQLEPSASSSSSFIIALFLIQMLRWIRGSSRVELFILLIAWGIFFGWWELDLPVFFSLIMSRASSYVCSSQLLKVITSFWHTFLEWMNPMILGGHSRWLSQLMHFHFFFYYLKLFFYLRDPFKVCLYGLYILDLHILQLVSQSHVLINFVPLK